MNRGQKLFGNPAISTPRQLRFNHTLDPRGYWGSIPTNLDQRRIHEMLTSLSVERCWLSDPSELAIGIATGHMPQGYGYFTVHDLLSVTEHETLFPSSSNRILHRIGRDIRGELIGDAGRVDMPLDQLPRCHEEAWERRLNGHMAAPPWLSNHHAMDILEKTIRMRIYDLWPRLKAAEEVEHELYLMTSKVFLATGWHLCHDADDALPAPHVIPGDVQAMIARGHKALEAFNSIDWQEFIDAMILPEQIFEMGEECGYLAPTVPGCFVDVGEVQAEDIELIHDAIHNIRWAKRVGKEPWHVADFPGDALVYGHIERLNEFIRSTESSHSPSPVATATHPTLLTI